MSGRNPYVDDYKQEQRDMNDEKGGDPPTRNPSKEIPVLLIGTFHLDNPNRDLANAQVGGVLEPPSQSALERLAEELAAWEPTVVAVEAPHTRREPLNTLYKSYRRGERSYDEMKPMPEPFSDTFARNEVVQIGFRLAEMVELDEIEPIDHETSIPAYTSQSGVTDVFNSLPRPDEVEYDVATPADIEKDIEDLLAKDPLDEAVRAMNQPALLKANHDLMFAASLEHQDEDAAIGHLVAWYERNIRTVRTLYSRCAIDDRVVLVFGNGHINVLRHLLEEAPMFRPISANTVLA